jgi:hypothetical protein
MRVAEGGDSTPLIKPTLSGNTIYVDSRGNAILASDDLPVNYIAAASKPSPGLEQVDRLMIRFGQRALRDSGGDWRIAEQKFDAYGAALNARLQATGSTLRIEFQPAALVGEGRVPNFIHMHRGGESSPLITDRNGDPRLFAYPNSRRLDAGVVDLRDSPDEFGLRPLQSGYDITLDARKRDIVSYYREAFGDVPIEDIRLKR